MSGYRRTLSRSSTLPSDGKGEDQEKSAQSVKVLTGMTAASLSRSSGSSGKKLSSERDAQVSSDYPKHTVLHTIVSLQNILPL